MNKDISPSQFDFYEILEIRGADYFTEQKKLYRSLKFGVEGEQKVLKYLQEYAPANWTVLQNQWLRDFDRFECDLIVLTENQVYVLEVKHYQGMLIYENGRCFYNGQETSLNPFEQIRTTYINLNRLCAQVSSGIDMKAAVIFAGDDHEVIMKTALKDIRVVRRNGIRNFILDIVQQEKHIHAEPINHAKLLRLFDSCGIDNPYQPAPLSVTELKHIRSGIYCANCHSFNVQITKSSVICACGLHQSREEAVVRAICDYGVLTYGQPLTLKELHAFLDAQVSKTFLNKILQKHFSFSHKSKQVHYINFNLPYSKIKNSFTFKQPTIFYHSDKNISVY